MKIFLLKKMNENHSKEQLHSIQLYKAFSLVDGIILANQV